MDEKQVIVQSDDQEKTYRIEKTGTGCVKITFGEVTYAISFFQYGHDIQSLLETRYYRDEITDSIIDCLDCDTIVFDFSTVIWFDSLALCYLILFLYDAKAKYGDILTIKIVYPKDKNLRAFLIDNGFLRHFLIIDPSDSSNITECWENVDYSKVHKCFFPFDVIGTRDVINDTLLDIRLLIENAFSSSIGPKRLEHFVNKIMYFLQETLENVYDHAYSGGTGRCGILIKNVNCSSDIDYSKYAKNYTSKTPYIKINMYEDSDAYLEIYVLDTGCGLRNSFDPNSDVTDSDILDFIFENGERSHKKMKRAATRYGGLHDIRELFDQDADGLGIKADNFWKYVYKYSKGKGSDRINPRIKFKFLKSKDLSGLAIHGFALVASVHLPKIMPDSVENSVLAEVASKVFDDLFFGSVSGDLLEPIVVKDERWDVKFGQPWVNHNNPQVSIIYPPLISTKQWITNAIYAEMHEGIVFYGVPDAEMKKYTSNIIGINVSRGKVNVKRIHVVSKSLIVSSFVQGDRGYFVCSESVRDAFVRSIKNNVTSVMDSFSSLLKVDKIYSSWLFWTMAQNYLGESAYINEKIAWSDETTIDGYLDFSQIIRIPECRDICIQKLQELRVLKNGVYFFSADRFTDEICDRANYVLEGERENTQINIGSVYVSGKSNRLLAKEEECFYFLRHPNAANKQIKSLLLWPNEKLVPAIVEPASDRIAFERLGNSSFIARGGANYWLKRHFSKPANGFRLDNTTIYNLLQRKVGVHPDTLKIGHFETTQRHDLFGYRVNNWFDSDTVDRQLKPNYENDSIYDFLMTHFIFALHGKIKKEDFDQCLNKSISEGKRSALWSKYFNADDKPSTQIDGLIVYLSDFQTSMLVEKVSNCFTPQETRRIIPLISLSRTYEAGSLIVSPIILDRIEKQIDEIRKNNTSVIVTVFDSVVFNVRLIEEVKQILYGVGAGSVKVLTVLDRRRIPVTELQPSIKALGRVDSPALQGNGICATCKAWEKLDKIKNQILNQDIVSRVNEIKTRWQCIRLSDNDYKKGMESNRIELSPQVSEILKKQCEHYWGPSLKIELDSALCSLVVEHSVISGSPQLLMCLLDEENLLTQSNEGITSEEVKILLASTYLLLFAGNPITNREINRIVDRLRKLLDAQEGVSSFTSLAVMAICSLPDDFLQILCNKYECYEDEIENSDGKAINEDSIIARIVVYLSSKAKFSDDIKMDSIERRIRCYLDENHSKLACLYDIFMYSERYYKNSHRHAFAQIIDNSAARPIDYQSALEYTKKLSAIIDNDNVFASLFHDRKILENNKNRIITELNEATVNLEKMVEFQKGRDDNNPKLQSEVRVSVERFVNSLVELNTKNLYLRTTYSQESDKNSIVEWLDYCKTMAVQRMPKCKEPSFLYTVQSNTTCNDSRPWFYSFRDVTEEVINLMVDIIHYSAGKFLVEQTWVDGFVRVLFHKAFVEISFYNSTNARELIDDVRAIKKSKSNRDSMLVFNEFTRMLNQGGCSITDCIEWDYSSKNIFKAVMRIPYINRGSTSGPDVFERTNDDENE